MPLCSRCRPWLLSVLTVATVFGLAAFAAADEPPAFSKLPEAQREQLKRMVEPPPLAERSGPYSTPMYYLLHSGYSYKGDLDKGPEKRAYKRLNGTPGPDYGHWSLDRNRPDFQEAIVRDWAELGLNNTHLNLYPVKGSLEISPDYRKAIEDYVALSKKYGLKVGVRLDALGGPKAWEMHPANPENKVEEYLVWAREIATLLKGQTAYYVLGDELTLHRPAPDLPTEAWTVEQYLAYFKRVSAVIKEVDPTAKVSMFAASSGQWFNILYLLEHGYAEHGDGVAINHYDYKAAPKFFADAARLAPKLQFLSNGVGYVSLGTIQPRYPEGDPYSKYKDEQAHGNAIAKHMFAWWDLGAATAPYYVCLRNWVLDGKVYPRWYGFFGFQDFVIDTKKDELTVKRYPGWYAFQTVAHTFYDRERFTKPAFDVKSSEELSMFRAYEHKVPGGSELVLMLWNDKGEAKTTIDIGSAAYRYPVRVNTFDYRDWSDVPYTAADGRVTIEVQADRNPTIIRLFSAEGRGDAAAEVAR